MDPTIASILFPIDFSRRCEDAATQVEMWAQHFSASVVVLNIIDSSDLYSDPSRFQEEFEEGLPLLEARAKTNLELFCNRYLPRSGSRQLTLVGDTVESILMFARKERPDILMVPRAHQTFGSRLLHDSLVAKLLDRCPVPIWTTEHSESISVDLPRKILCAMHVLANFEMDTENGRLLKSARLIAKTFAASLTILHVTTSEERAVSPISERLLSIQTQMKDIAQFERATGDIRTAILSAAKRLGADLILSGRTRPATVGLGVQGHLLTVDHLARCPIVSIY